MRTQIKEFLPIAILLVIGIASVIQVLTTDYIFTYKQYIGLTLVAVCTALFFINRKFYKLLLGFTLSIGTLNIIGFSTAISTFGLSIVRVQLTSIVVLFVFILVFKEDLERLFTKPESETEKQEKFDDLKEVFKRRFKSLSDQDIDEKLGQKLVPEALAALEEIKAERI